MLALLQVVALFSFAFFAHLFSLRLESGGLLEAMPALSASFVFLGIAEALRMLRANESYRSRNARHVERPRSPLWRT